MTSSRTKLRNKLGALVAVLLALVAMPAIAQMGFSDSFNFLKAVRERDGATADRILNGQNAAVLNTRDRATGEGALHILVRGRDGSWLGYMLSKGLRPDIQSDDGSTPLMFAAQIGWIDGAERLIRGGANVNLGNNRGETALILAVQRNDIAMVRLLIAQRADPNQTDSIAGYSALDYARQDPRRAAVLQALQNAGTPTRQRPMMGPPAPGQQ